MKHPPIAYNGYTFLRGRLTTAPSGSIYWEPETKVRFSKIWFGPCAIYSYPKGRRTDYHPLVELQWSGYGHTERKTGSVTAITVVISPEDRHTDAAFTCWNEGRLSIEYTHDTTFGFNTAEFVALACSVAKTLWPGPLFDWIQENTPEPWSLLASDDPTATFRALVAPHPLVGD